MQLKWWKEPHSICTHYAHLNKNSGICLDMQRSCFINNPRKHTISEWIKLDVLYNSLATSFLSSMCIQMLFSAYMLCLDIALSWVCFSWSVSFIKRVIFIYFFFRSSQNWIKLQTLYLFQKCTGAAAFKVCFLVLHDMARVLLAVAFWKKS